MSRPITRIVLLLLSMAIFAVMLYIMVIMIHMRLVHRIWELLEASGGVQTRLQGFMAHMV